MPWFARLCECIPCFARNYYIYIFISLYIYALLCRAVRMHSLLCMEIHIYIYALLCKDVLMYPLLCKEILYIYIYTYAPALQGCANVFPALQGNTIYT